MSSTVSLRRALLVASYPLAAAFGYALTNRSPAEPASAPLARVGFALKQERVLADPHAWAALRNDVEAVRRGLKENERAPFDLVMAVRGLETNGEPDWKRAEESCRSLKWPRCERAELEELARRSRP